MFSVLVTQCVQHRMKRQEGTDWCRAAMALWKVMSRHLSGETNENHEIREVWPFLFSELQWSLYVPPV
jgi:hypothetical protein